MTNAKGGSLIIVGNVNNTSGVITGATYQGATLTGGTVSGATNGQSSVFNNVAFTGATLTNGTISGASTATGTNVLTNITNTGALSVNSGSTTLAGATTNTGGTITSAGGTTVVTGTVAGGTMNVTGGTLNIASGANADPLLFQETSGAVTLSGGMTVSTADLLGGTFDGRGSFSANTIDNGTTASNGLNYDVNGSAAAWGGTATIGTVNVGTYNQTAGGTLSINFNSGFSGNDELNATAGVSLGGALDLLTAAGAELNTASLNKSQAYVLIDLGGDNDVTGQFSTVNAIGIVGQASGTAGTTSGWWVIYNGSHGDGDVELDFVGASSPAPEPGTDILLGGALIGLTLLRKKLTRR